MVGQPHQNFMKMASWSSVSEHLVNPIGMSDQLKWNNQDCEKNGIPHERYVILVLFMFYITKLILIININNNTHCEHI